MERAISGKSLESVNACSGLAESMFELKISFDSALNKFTDS